MENKIMFLVVAIIILYLLMSKKGRDIITNFIKGTSTNSLQSEADKNSDFIKNPNFPEVGGKMSGGVTGSANA